MSPPRPAMTCPPRAFITAVDTLMGKGSILGFQASDLQGWGQAEVEGMGPGGDRIFDAPSHGQTLPPLSSVATQVGAHTCRGVRRRSRRHRQVSDPESHRQASQVLRVTPGRSASPSWVWKQSQATLILCCKHLPAENRKKQTPRLY